nr:cysteine-rich receptor-like protein kinase 26 isoform X2 [Lolium perenne]
MEFEKEYHNIASLHHKNIVRLIGYCHETRKEFMTHNGRTVFAEKTKRMLCFEYMHNGSLDKFISDESNGHNWLTRYAIIKGISEGLEYLHEKLNPPMYHLDLKPANVLLDENMSPKIADFGLSRLVGGDKTHFTENRIGTLGYIPPEHIDAGAISTKSDVYSFGVVIIKIMAGPDGYRRSSEISSQQFIDLVHTYWMNRIHATSVGMYSIQVRRCIEIALSCVETDRDKRPSIGLIVTGLNKTESGSHVLDALRSQPSLPTSQLCPCITTDDMLDLLKEKLISYQLRITYNRSTPHLVTITTACDPEVGTSKSEVRFANQLSSHAICLNYPCITILSNIYSLVHAIVFLPTAMGSSLSGSRSDQESRS